MSLGLSQAFPELGLFKFNKYKQGMTKHNHRIIKRVLCRDSVKTLATKGASMKN